jgi:signal peptidase II
MKKYKYCIIIILILFDQFTKLYTHFNMDKNKIGEIKIINKVKVHYILNPGIAFGIQIGYKNEKSFIVIAKIIIISIILIQLNNIDKKRIIKNKTAIPLVLITTGAIGNFIDNIFYGKIINNYIYNSNIIYGQVIDMIYINIYDLKINKFYISILPIFNMSDIFITIGVMIMIIEKIKNKY